MLDQLFNLVKEYSQEPVINNPEIPNEQNSEIVAEATNTVASGLQNVMAGGGLQNIIQMFTGGNGGGGLSGLLKNPMVAMMIGHFTRKLISRHHMSPQSAGAVANNLIPNVLQGLIQRTNDPSNSQFDLNKILNSLSGGSADDSNGTGENGFDIGGLVSRFTGGNTDTDGDGDVDLQDMIGKLTKRTQNSLQKQSGGGILDMLKGMIG